MSTDVLISQLLDLPARVHRGDFVLNLSEGVTPGRRGAAGAVPPQPAHPAARSTRGATSVDDVELDL